MAYTAAGAPRVAGGLRGAMRRGNERSMLNAMAARLMPRGGRNMRVNRATRAVLARR